MPAAKTHEYALRLTWEGNRGAGTCDYAGYERQFRVSFEGKADLLGSADPAFRGDPRLQNPEELLLAAVASCHMLTYLALCARAGISVVSYSDTPRGTLLVQPSGGGSFEGITLLPQVAVAPANDIVAAGVLHLRAHEQCFIASSCRFPTRCEPTLLIGAPAPVEGRKGWR